MASKPDTETAQQLREAQELRNLVAGAGWSIATKILEDMTLALESVSTIPDNMTLEEIALETLSRKRTLNLINRWKEAIETHVSLYERYMHNQPLAVEEDAIIRTLD